MHDEETPRQLTGRTGRQYCASCLKETPAEEYFAGDFFCRACAEKSATFPHASTPSPAEPPDQKD
jgi:hypothetical protein